MSDVVTAIEQGRGVVRVTFNDDEQLLLSRADWRELPLSLGEELELADYQRKLLLRQYPEALNRAVALLALRSHSAYEIRVALKRRHYQEDTVDMVLCKLEKEGFVNDQTFASGMVDAGLRMHKGKQRIAMELKRKGVSAELIQNALADVDEDELRAQAETAAEKLLRRYHELDADEAIRKVVDRMRYRGYSYDEASRAAESALQKLMEQQ